MEKQACVSCQSNKATLTCVSCNEGLCKSCAEFVDENTFPFLTEFPGNLASGAYCRQCYDSKAEPEVTAYEEKMEQARNISVYMKNQGKEVRLLKRSQFPVEVADCEDREETLLRLAFKTVEAGYDTLITVELIPKKTRSGSYVKTYWHGRGVPAVGRKGK